MPTFSLLAVYVFAISCLSTFVHGIPNDVKVQEPLQASFNGPQLAPTPFYAVAHRVLTTQGVRDALKNGANAIEIDCIPYKDAWYADHDGTGSSAGDKMETMFKTIAEQRRGGKPVTFVWLDLKTKWLDWCAINDPKWSHICSVKALQDLARQHLLPAGVRVLYGFYGGEDSDALKWFRKTVGDKESIAINGRAKVVANSFIAKGPAFHQRVMSYGYHTIAYELGNCREDGYYTCTELRQGASMGVFNHVFGWTAQRTHEYSVNFLFNNTRIDGLIYGFDHTYYYDHDDVRTALAHIKNGLARTNRYLAGANDFPW